ncbi:MAG: DUF4943 family protein [Planctomycetota bacterium]
MRPDYYPLDGLIIAEKPLVTEDDIIFYDWKKQKIHLKPGVSGRLPEVDRPFKPNVPFVVVANGQRIYLGAFMSIVSSELANMPDITQGLGTGNVIHISKGVHINYPGVPNIPRFNWQSPVDATYNSRFDVRIRNALASVGKLLEDDVNQTLRSEVNLNVQIEGNGTTQSRGVREVYLPNIDKVAKMLDLDSGNLLTLSGVESDEQLFALLDKRNKSAVLYDGDNAKGRLALFRSDVSGCESMDEKGFTVITFKFSELPTKFVAETLEGNRYRIKIEQADDYQCLLTYYEISNVERIPAVQVGREYMILATAPDKWTRILPDGDTIKLIALFSPQDTPAIFWDPSGTIIEGPKLAGHDFEGASGRELAYVLQRPENKIKNGHEHPAPDGNFYTVSGWNSFELESHEPPIIKYPCGYGDWEDLATIRKGQVVIKDNNWYKLERVGGFEGRNAQVHATVFHSSDPAFGIRLVPVNKDGKQYPMKGRGSSFIKDRKEMYFDAVMGIEPDSVDHFLIQKQKWNWSFIGGFATELNGQAEPSFVSPPLTSVDSIAGDNEGWETISSVRANSSVDIGFHGKAEYTIDQPVAFQNYTIHVKVTHTFDREEYQVRMVGVKKNGNIVESYKDGTGGSTLSKMTYIFDHAPLEFYKEFQFQIRSKSEAKPDVQVNSKREENVRKAFSKYVSGKTELKPDDIIYDSLNFYWSDIPVLLELAESDKVINYVPKSHISSWIQFKGGIEDMVALWIIEGLRTGQIITNQVKPQDNSSTIPYWNDKYRPLNPACLIVSAEGEIIHAYADEQAISPVIHQEVLSAYQSWWQRVHSLEPVQAAKVDPLTLTDLEWFGRIYKPDVQVEVQNSLATEATESTENNQKSDVQVEAEDSSINVVDKSDESLDARSQRALKMVREFISAVKAGKYEIAKTYLLSESEQADEWPESEAIKDLPLLNTIKDFKNVTIPDQQLTVVMGDWESGVREAFLVSSDLISNDGEAGELFFTLADMAVFRPDAYESEHWAIKDIALTKFKLQMPPDLQKESDKLVSKIQRLIPYINFYAKDHEGDLPDELSVLDDYGLDGYELFGGPVWWHKVIYHGKGKNLNLADPSRIIVAHCVVSKRCSFYRWPILYLDGHIETRTWNRQDLEVGLKEISKKPDVQVDVF